MTRDLLAELARWADPRLGRLTDDVYARVLERIDLYRTENLVPHDDLHRSVRNNLQFIIGAITDPNIRPDLSIPAETGRRRAQQGVPLPEVLQAYRIGFATVWDAMVDHARHSQHPATTDGLLTATGIIWQLADEHALALIEAYRRATADLLTAQERRRSALVEALLTGHPGPEGGPWEAATLLGFPANGHLAVVAAETRKLAEESLPGIEERLAAREIASAWRLAPGLQLGIASLPDARCDTLVAVARSAASARAGVSPPYRSPADTPRALRLAQAALAAIPSGRADVRLFSDSPLAALVACGPGEARRLARQVLGTVLDLPSDDRTVLLDTLHAYVDHGGSADRTARALHCHPNTIRYRLRRIQEWSGRSLSDPLALAELATAMYALHPENEPAAQ